MITTKNGLIKKSTILPTLEDIFFAIEPLTQWSWNFGKA